MTERLLHDVERLVARPAPEGVALAWEWPEGCTLVRVARRADRWPVGPEDRSAVWLSCTRSEYLDAGERFLDRLAGSEGFLERELFYVAYAQRPGRNVAFSPGTGAGCRASVRWSPWTTVRYEIAPDGGSGRLHLRWDIDRVPHDFAGFALVASPDRVPASLDDGLELFRWAPWRDHAGALREAVVDLEPARRLRWSRVFCKAVTVDPAQRHTTLFIHPSTCVPVHPAGSLARRASAPSRFRQGAPESVVCPSCFERFPVDGILYASYDDEEPAVAPRSLLGKLAGAPPRPPVGRRGRLLTRKLCPSCKRDLPFASGVQPSLVLGLIGAKFSGKSHYVASLIRRLEGQAGTDFDMSLIAVNDETQERYRREFHEPLFGRRLELPVTVGTPPPLIYDLAIGGALWGERRGRSATLSLYDTAGENFDDRESVRRMASYLGVASGIVLLVDPLQAPSVRESLPDSLGLPDLDRMADPQEIVSRVIQELDGGAAAMHGGPLDVPVAVVLTKCDVLRDAGLLEPNRLWHTEARHSGVFDRRMHDDMSGMFGEYLLKWSPATFNSIVRRFTRHAFFGVSATGCASDPATRRYRHVTPWRVEEPLLWLLCELGLVPIR